MIREHYPLLTVYHDEDERFAILRRRFCPITGINSSCDAFALRMKCQSVLANRTISFKVLMLQMRTRVFRTIIAIQFFKFSVF